MWNRVKAGTTAVLFCMVGTVLGVGVAPSPDVCRISSAAVERPVRPWTEVGDSSSTTADIHWVVFRGHPGSALRALDSAGVTYHGFHRRENGAYIYKFGFGAHRQAVLGVLHSVRGFVNAYPVLACERVSREIWMQEDLDMYTTNARDGVVRAHVDLHGTWEESRLWRLLSAYVDTVLALDAGRGGHAVVAARPFLLRKLAELDAVEFVGPYVAPELTVAGSRRQIGLDSAQSFRSAAQLAFPPVDTMKWHYNGSGYDNKLTGEGVVVGVYDDGVDSAVLDLSIVRAAYGDTVRRYSSPSGHWPTQSHKSHGTWVTGAILGNGWRSATDSIHALNLALRGMAPRATYYTSNYAVTGTNNAGDVNNHSHTLGAGYYDQQNHNLDDVLSCHDTSLDSVGNIGVYAVGNSGSGTPSGRGYYSMGVDAKNAIKVGSADKFSRRKTIGSSQGPMYDGRIGPDVLTPTYASYRFDGWTVELDYVRLERPGQAVNWEMNTPSGATACDSFGFGCAGEFFNLRAGGSGTSMAFETHDFGVYHTSPHIYSNAISFTADTSATLSVRYRITDDSASSAIQKGIERFGWLDFFWRTDTVNTVSPYWDTPRARMLVKVNAGWQTLTVRLSRAHQYDPATTEPYRETQIWTAALGTIRRVCLGFLPPDVVVPGRSAMRAQRAFAYEDAGGTSLAAPQVTGVVAAMLQKYADDVLSVTGGNIHDNPFWNSTARAVLIHTAEDLVDTARRYGCCSYNLDFHYWPGSTGLEDLYGAGPDWSSGYGLVNASRAIAHVTPNCLRQDTLGHNQIRFYRVHVGAATDTLRVTLAWDDPAGAVGTTAQQQVLPALVNNLELYAIPPSDSGVGRPAVISDAPFHPTGKPSSNLDGTWVNGTYTFGMCPDTLVAHPARAMRDSVNNTEKVVVADPDTGYWTVVVEGRSVPANQSAGALWYLPMQEYSLVTDSIAVPVAGGLDEMGIRITEPTFGTDRDGLLSTSSGRMMVSGAHIAAGSSGLRFGSVGALDTAGNLVCTAMESNQSAWLDNVANLSGCLVFRNTAGTAVWAMRPTGVLKLRSSAMEGQGTF